MSFKSIFKTILLFISITIGIALFDYSCESTEKSDVNTHLIADNCDPSQWTYKTVLIDGVWWIQVYDCDGVIIDEYPAD